MGKFLSNLSNLCVFVFLEKFWIFSNFFIDYVIQQEQIIPNISHYHWDY